jgi:hypothetical protein
VAEVLPLRRWMFFSLQSFPDEYSQDQKNDHQNGEDDLHLEPIL